MDVVKDYHCNIFFRPHKVNVVVDALSCKSDGSSVGDICMRIFIDSPLLGFIREAHANGVRDDIDRFTTNSQGLLFRCGLVYVLFLVGSDR